MAVPIWRFKSFENCSIYMKICIPWVFGSLILNALSDFRNLKWRFQYGGSKFWKLFNFYESLYTLGFWVADFEYVVRFSKFKMVVQSFENCSIYMRICIHWVFGSLILNALSDFRNSKWRCQYAGSKLWKLFNFHENLYTLGFWIADFEYALKFLKFIMVDPISWIWLLGPPYWIRYFKFQKSDNRYVLNAPKYLKMQSRKNRCRKKMCTAKA